MQDRSGYRIDWDCSCGEEGTVRGKDREDAWRRVDAIRDEHANRGHREFGVTEQGYTEHGV